MNACKKSDEIVKQFALGLQKLDLELIVFILHPELRFLYRIGYFGYGITTNIRYIGHLYKTFLSMKKGGISIKMEFCYIIKNDFRLLGIKILPPHDSRIIYPNVEQMNCEEKDHLPKAEMAMRFTTKNELICRIKCLEVYKYNNKDEGFIMPYSE
jgi:hypothetical protein